MESLCQQATGPLWIWTWKLDPFLYIRDSTHITWMIKVDTLVSYLQEEELLENLDDLIVEGGR